MSYLRTNKNSSRAARLRFLSQRLKVRGGSRNFWICYPPCRKARSASAWLSCWRVQRL